MKPLFLILSIITFISCQSQKEVTAKIANSIQDVYFEGWVAGVRGGGAGINFHVIFKSPLSKDMQLQKVVFKGKEADFSKRGDAHYIANIITKIGGRSNPEKEEAVAVLPESNQAELYFVVNGKSVVHILENVNEKETLAYPVMNKPRE